MISGDDAEERQGDDVNLGVTEEPEQVLPQKRAARFGVVDLSAKDAVRSQGRRGPLRGPGTP